MAVSLTQDIVSIDGEPYSVTPDTATLLDAIVQRNGLYVAATEIVSRPDRLMKRAPDAVTALVIRTNNGYRLADDYVTNTPT